MPHFFPNHVNSQWRSQTKRIKSPNPVTKSNSPTVSTLFSFHPHLGSTSEAPYFGWGIRVRRVRTQLLRQGLQMFPRGVWNNRNYRSPKRFGPTGFDFEDWLRLLDPIFHEFYITPSKPQLAPRKPTKKKNGARSKADLAPNYHPPPDPPVPAAPALFFAWVSDKSPLHWGHLIS